MAKKEKRPMVDVTTQCPDCQSSIRVKVHRKRTNPVEPPIYEYDVTAEKVLLPPEEEGVS